MSVRAPAVSGPPGITVVDPHPIPIIDYISILEESKDDAGRPSTPPEVTKPLTPFRFWYKGLGATAVGKQRDLFSSSNWISNNGLTQGGGFSWTDGQYF
jgi:hypothetical protein